MLLGAKGGPPPPVNTVAPVITGSNVGAASTCTTGTWNGSPTSYTYQWKVNGGNIGGATNSSYTPVAGDAGKTLSCAVTATNAGGSATAQSNGIVVVAGTSFTITAGQSSSAKGFFSGQFGSCVPASPVFNGAVINQMYDDSGSFAIGFPYNTLPAPTWTQLVVNGKTFLRANGQYFNDSFTGNYWVFSGTTAGFVSGQQYTAVMS